MQMGPLANYPLVGLPASIECHVLVMRPDSSLRDYVYRSLIGRWFKEKGVVCLAICLLVLGLSCMRPEIKL